MEISPKLLNKMSPELKLLIFGMGEDKVQELRDSVDYTFREYEGNSRFTEEDLDEELKKQVSVVTSLGFTAGAALTSRRIEERFSYQTQPAFNTSSKIMGEYGSKVMAAFGRAEEISHGWGTTAGQTALAITTLATSVIVSRAIAAARGVATTVKTLGNINRARKIITGIRGAFTLAGGLGGIVGSVAGFAVGSIVQELTYRLFVNLTKGRAERLAFSEMAADMFDRQRVLNDFEQYRGVLQGFSGYDGTNAYAIFDRILEQERHGVSMERYGFDYNKMANLSRQLITNGMMTDENFEGYMGRAMQLESLFGADFSSIMTGASILTFGDKDVDEASQLFEEFFVSVAGGGVPHVSQLALVQELMSFSQSYVQGQKFNMEGYQNLARISNFLTPIYNMHTTQPIQNLVTGVDSALSRGVLGDSRVMTEFMANYGISQREALQGLTSTPEVFEKFLSGIVKEIGIGYDSFGPDGQLSEEKMIHLFRYAGAGLNMDNSTIQSLIPAIRAYVGGARVTDVSRGYFEENEVERAGVLDRFGYTSLLTEFGRGHRTLSSMISENLDIMKEIDTLTVRMYTETTPQILSTMGDMVVTIAKSLGYELEDGAVVWPEVVVPYSGAASVAAATQAATVAVIREQQEMVSEIYFNQLFDSLVYQESRGVHTTADGSLLSSGAGALGITQIMPDTGKSPGYGVAPLKDDSKEEYIRFGRDYLSALIRHYDGDVKKALAAYNWGGGNVNKAVRLHGEDWINHLPEETENYISGVLGRTSGYTYQDTSQYEFNSFVDNDEEEGYNDLDKESPSDDEDYLEIDLDAGIYYNDRLVEYVASRVMG